MNEDKLRELTAFDKSAYTEELEPVFPNCNNAIVFESSGLYAPYLDVAIRSLISNISDNNYYDIIILTSEIDIYDCNLLRSEIENYNNVSLRFYDPSKLVEPYINTSRYRYLNLNYYRLALPWILQKYEKILNLGMDIVIKKDVSELLKIQMSDTEYIAGVKDLGYIGRLSMDIPKEELNLKNPEGYINADVIVLNNKNIRRDFSLDSVLELWQKYKFRCAEQDAFNVLFENHIHYLDMKWNVFPRKMNSIIHIAHNSDENIQIYKASVKDPYIVHFAAFPKSWDYPTVEYAELWWYYARKSPYYEELIRRMILANKGLIYSKLSFKQKVYNKLAMFSRKHTNIFIKVGKKVFIKYFTNSESNHKWGKLGGK